MPFAPPSRRIFARTFTVVLGACMSVIALLAAGTFLMLGAEYKEDVEERLMGSSQFLVSAVESGQNLEAVLKVCEDFAKRTNIRTTIISSENGLLFDSESIPEGAPLRGYAPEVEGAIGGKKTFLKRPSYVLGIDMFYLALPACLNTDGKPQYCVRLALPARDLAFARETILQQLAGLAAAAVLLAAAIAYAAAKKAGEPLAKLAAAAREFSSGNFDWPIDSAGLSELAEVAESMREMARQLKTRMDSLKSVNAELKEIFSVMSEPLFICSADGCVLRMNKTAMAFFCSFSAGGKFKKCSEIFKEPKLLSAIEKTFKSEAPQAFEIEFQDAKKTAMSVMGIRMPEDENGKPRAMFIMHDISPMRKLERQRRSFVASVSHELRTPITSILGAAETMHDADSLSDVRRFSAMIEKAATRMNLLVDDMVLLSRIEACENRRDRFFRDADISRLMDEAIETHELSLAHRGQRLAKNYAPSIPGFVDPTLLTIAVSNLVDNAIKYSPAGSEIRVSARSTGGMLEISVSDCGDGIPPECAGRIFERFYRCESGRKLNPSGSGIGLAIVKHIAIMHGGNASMESAAGRGSVFKITIEIGNIQ